MIKTVIIGASGFIGGHLLKSYRRQFSDCVGTSFSHPQQDLIPFDIRSPDLSKLRLEEKGYKAIILAAAKSRIEYCENEKEKALQVNICGMKKLVEQLSKSSMQIIFLSTDYVFDGARGNYDDLDPTGPTTEYGRHKEILEKEIKKLTDNFLIIRLSKIFGLKKGDGTILDDLARKIVNNEEILAANDQFFCPTYIGDLVNAIHQIQNHQLKGIFNLCGDERWSRYQLAISLAKQLRCSTKRIKKVNLYDLPSMAGRPLNTTLKCSRLKEALGFKFRPMQEHLQKVAFNYSVPQRGRSPYY